MGFTDKFRAQHEEILAVAGDLTEKINAGADAAAVRKILSNLAGKVNFHLAMEDKALYPRMMKQQGSNAPAVAAKFLKEMGGLSEVFTNYNSKWQVTAIRADTAGFSNETRKVVGALAHRIARENADLYPLADSGS
jgi:iron-sulfur cluster repair protein YtfE (RIC family)